MDTIQQRPPVLVNAITKKPVPVLCQSADTCKKYRCILKYLRRLEKCEGYRRGELKLKLLKLRLTNFKGCRSLEINADGKNVNVYGDNETGKTTIFDAFMWLLFDKDSLNRSTFGIKTLENGEPIPGIDHEVEGVFDLDGIELNLKKTYREVYTRKRGSATEEFTGHTTDYFINEVPSKKSEFDSKIKSIAPEALFRLLTNPLYFNEQLHWQERRKILFEMCGDITDAEVFESDKNLQELADILKSRSIDEHKKVIAAKRKEINEQLDRIPIRIDEANKAKPDIKGLNFAEIDKKINELTDQEEKLRIKLQSAKSGGGIAEKQKEIAELDTQIITLENEARAKKNKILGEYQSKLTTSKSEWRDYNSIYESISKNIDTKKKIISGLETKIKIMRDSWSETSKLVFEGSSICPTCGQKLPEEKIEEAIAAWNKAKSEKLQTINEDGKALKSELESEKNELADLENKLTENAQKIDLAYESVKEWEQAIEDAKNLGNEIDATLFQRKEALLKEIDDIESGSASEVEKIKGQYEDVHMQLLNLRQDFAKKEQFENSEKRIKELKAQQKQLAAEFENLQSQLYLAEEFTRAKVQLLDQKINSHFENARFKLFEEQINGGLSECCTVTYKGVPYTDLNNAGRINIGLEIISVLSAHYGFYAPIFVDNAESVTKLYDADSQVIRLVVSEQDKKLRVEIEEE